LEERLADLPADWHLRSVGSLERLPRRRRRLVPVDTSVVLRAVGILLIVCTHMHLYRVPGGAHLLLAVAGFNFARFQLAPGIGHRLRRGMATVARVAIPTTVWIGINMAVAGGYSLGALFLVNNYFGSPWRRDGRWQYWYFEAFVQIVVVLVVVFAIPAVRRLEERFPFGVACAALGASLVLRFGVLEFGDDYNAMFRPHTVLCFFALGWCAQRAATVQHRLIVTGAAALTVFGYFDQQFDRELRILLAVAALVWVVRVPLPRLVARAVGVLAATSMYIFLVHWQIWPVLDRTFDDRVAYVLTILAGVAVGLAAERAWSGARRLLGQTPRRVGGRVVGGLRLSTV
jgi:peptidoglycan/LPS O-acetylase OafA/YrhL